jgi:uncharacterized membrane protein
MSGGIRTAVLTFIVILTNVLGNFFLSWGLKRPMPAADYVPPALGMFLSPWVIAGIVLLIAWTLSRMALLSWADLSFVLPVTALGYPLAAVMGRVFLDEQISPQRWAGTLLILAGFVLVGHTAPKTT